MTRWIYIALLRLHPRRFRERFSEEMIGIFDEESRQGTQLRLLVDAATSVLRQRLCRAARIAPTPASAYGMPMFQFVEPGPLNPNAIITGAAMTLLSFAALSFAISRGGGPLAGFLTGAKHPRASVAETSTEVRVRPRDPDVMDQQTQAYFDAIRVLEALDIDRDQVLSEKEIANAPVVLGSLDGNGDGELDAEECGFSIGTDDGPRRAVARIEEARRAFMRTNPVLAALDGDHDGKVAIGEIQAAATSLRSLDSNRDGRLAPMEVLPVAAGSGPPVRVP